MIGIVHQVYTVGKIGGQDDIVTIKMLDHAILLQRHNPAGILVHAIVNYKKRMAAAQRCFYQNRRVQLQDHS